MSKVGKPCRVPFCANKYKSRKDSPNVRFHEFPANLEIREKWLQAIRCTNYVPADYDTVCSIHFKKSDFVHGIKVIRLKPSAVPSIFPSFPKYLQPKLRKERRVIQRASPEVIASFKKSKKPKEAVTSTKSRIIANSSSDELPVEFQVFEIDENLQKFLESSNYSSPSKKDASTQADGLWDKIQELYRTIRQLRTDLNKKTNEIKDLSKENKKLNKEISHLKEETKLKAKKKDVSLTQQTADELTPTSVKSVHVKTVKEKDLSAYLHPRIPRSLYAQRGDKSVPSPHKMVLSVNHLNQLMVTQGKLREHSSIVAPSVPTLVFSPSNAVTQSENNVFILEDTDQCATETITTTILDYKDNSDDITKENDY